MNPKVDHTKGLPVTTSAVISPKTRRKGQRTQRGQSLAEFAISMPILILLFFGMIDLGRAFFTLVDLDSVISEGAHWAAAYPQCIASAANATDAPQVPAECKGTNSIIGRMLNESTNLDMAHVISTTVTPVTAQPGDTIAITISYRLDMVTPVIQAIAGQSIVLTAVGYEVVRTAGMPARTGVPMPNGGVNPTNPVDAHQTWTAGTGPTASCDHEKATIAWPAVSATGYHIFDGAVSSPYPAPYDTIVGGGTIPSTITWTYQFASATPPAAGGGNHTFTITSYNQIGTNPPTESSPTTVLVTCDQIQPSISPLNSVGWWCPDPAHAEFAWTMPTTSPNGVDTAVAGYGIAIVTGATAPFTYTFKGALTGNPAPYTYITLPSDKTATYAITALDSSNNLIGAYSTPVTINCAPGVGLVGNYYNGDYWTNATDNSIFTVFQGPPRTDLQINFPDTSGVPPTSTSDWGSPIAGSPDHFSVDWNGKVQAQYTDNYTFCLWADDGVKLYLNGLQMALTQTYPPPPYPPNPLYSPWDRHSYAQFCVSNVPMEAGKRYQIEIKYFENLGKSVIQLLWMAQVKAPTLVVVPAGYLYPPGS